MFEKNFKKIDLIKNLSLKTGLSSNYSKKLCNDFFNILIKNIAKGKYSLKNIGTFKVIFKKERLGRNPKTNQEFLISSRKSIIFRPSKKIIEKLDKLI